MSSALVASVQPLAPVVDYARELAGAAMLLRSGLLPKSIGTPEAALFIILTGRDLGLSPVQSLRSIYVIQGKVEVSADQQLGLFHRAGGRSQWVTLTNTEAVLRLSAPWLLEPHDESFTMEDAKRAGLDKPSRSGEASMFTKFPRPMLRSRAITAGLKSIGFDPTSGMYAPGEIGGQALVDGEAVMAAIEAPSAQPSAQVDANVIPAGAEMDPDTDPAESAALRELEELLPRLTVDQQIYVKEKLGSGSDPVRLLQLIKDHAPKAKAS
jgi:hypothetical protein